MQKRWFATAYQIGTTKDSLGSWDWDSKQEGLATSHNQLLSDQEWNTFTDQPDPAQCHHLLPQGEWLVTLWDWDWRNFHEASWCWLWEFQASKRNCTGSHLGSLTYWSSSKSLPCKIILLVLLPFGTPWLAFQQGWTWLRLMHMGLQRQRIHTQFPLVNWWRCSAVYAAFILSQDTFPHHQQYLF